MANIKYSDLLKEVLPHLTADPSDPFTENAIKRAVIEFCAESWVWKHLPDPIDVTASEISCDIEMPPGAEVSMVMDAALSGTPLEPKSIEWLNREVPRWRTEGGKPLYYTQIDPEQIILAPMPSESITGGLALTLALQPAQTANSFPKWIFSKYPYAITDGALAKLMLIPGKPWTDIANGSDRRARFDSAIANARVSSVRGLGRAPVRVSISQH